MTAEVVDRIKATSPGDLYVDGPTLAATALRLGVVDEVSLVLVPTVVGGGASVFPAGWRTGLTLLDERRFANGMVAVRYGLASP
jgi:riboflavin biosynthesis pyrimidine reductase